MDLANKALTAMHGSCKPGNRVRISVLALHGGCGRLVMPQDVTLAHAGSIPVVRP